MTKAKKIFLVYDSKDLTDKLLLADLRKWVKGYIRLGCDTQVFFYNHALMQSVPLKSYKIAGRFYKNVVDKLLGRQIENYGPDIVQISFAKYLDSDTVTKIRCAAPSAILVGVDVDIFPEMHEGRVETAKKLDVLFTTYCGRGIEAYQNAGVKCVFMPNICDPDIEYRYKVAPRWHSDILFTGKLTHKNYPTDHLRSKILRGLSELDRVALYGSKSGKMVFGLDYLYAISGAKTALSINADNNIAMYHSDRLTHYLACGTCVLAKRVPDSDRLFKDGRDLRYFDTTEEFFDLAKWYLKNDNERLRIADTGMQRVHHEFNCTKIAGYALNFIETGSYSAPWS